MSHHTGLIIDFPDELNAAGLLVKGRTLGKLEPGATKPALRLANGRAKDRRVRFERWSLAGSEVCGLLGLDSATIIMRPWGLHVCDSSFPIPLISIAQRR